MEKIIQTVLALLSAGGIIGFILFKFWTVRKKKPDQIGQLLKEERRKAQKKREETIKKINSTDHGEGKIKIFNELMNNWKDDKYNE